MNQKKVKMSNIKTNKMATAEKAVPAKKSVHKKRTTPAKKIAEVKQVTVLEEAQNLIYGQRQKDYGNARKNFSDIAKGWSVVAGTEISGEQVALMMTWLKICRANTGLKAGAGVHRDSAVDIAGYAGCLEKIEKGL